MYFIAYTKVGHRKSYKRKRCTRITGYSKVLVSYLFLQQMICLGAQHNYLVFTK